MHQGLQIINYVLFIASVSSCHCALWYLYIIYFIAIRWASVLMAIELWVIFQRYSFRYNSLFFNLMWHSWGRKRLQRCYIVHYWPYSKFAKPSSVILLWKAIHKLMSRQSFVTCGITFLPIYASLLDWLAIELTVAMMWQTAYWPQGDTGWL